MKLLVALVSGILFGLGLSISQMVDPAKVIGFLDITGAWDPSLALVMGGALLVTLPAFMLTQRRDVPLLDSVFHIPSYTEIDSKLVSGSALFGIGWGLAGYCPGPLFASLSFTNTPILLAFTGYVIGTVFVLLMRHVMRRLPNVANAV